MLRIRNKQTEIKNISKEYSWRHLYKAYNLSPTKIIIYKKVSTFKPKRFRSHHKSHTSFEIFNKRPRIIHQTWKVIYTLAERCKKRVWRNLWSFAKMIQLLPVSLVWSISHCLYSINKKTCSQTSFFVEFFPPTASAPATAAVTICCVSIYIG